MNATIDQPQDRVRRHTGAAEIATIDEKTRRNVRAYARRAPNEIGHRIHQLEHEWDVERTLEANASTLALTGAALGTTVNQKWFWLTGVVLTFLFQHATSGWCPPLPVLRKLGVRTQNEIDQEKFALKAIRGDFSRATQGDDPAGQTLDQVSSPESGDGKGASREPDRVRRYTSRAQLQRLDAAMARRVGLYANQPAETITERIQELRREWSIERYLQINVAAVGLTTTALAVTRNRNWGYAAGAGLAFFLFHAIEGFDPPLPALRKLGLRTRAEINREIYALKILRGDFDRVPNTPEPGDAALHAVRV